MAKSDSLFHILESEPLDPKPLAGLARTAADAPLDSMGCLTEYRPLQSRSILSKVNSKRGVPFTHAINPYRGCEFGCRYCYARYTHEFLEMRDPEDFERKIYFKENAAWLLTQELKRLKPGTHIALGTATDPYQPLERKQLLTRSILEVLTQASGFQLGIVTKSTLVARDIDLLLAIRQHNRLTVHLTVTTMNTKLARVLEPRAPRPDLRIETVAKLRQAGVRAGVLCSPLMPGITDSRSSMAAVARAAAAAGASFFASGALFLKPCSLPTFFAFVKKNFPEQLKAYELRYEKSAFVSPEYRTRVAELVDSVCKEHKLGRRYSETPQEDEVFERENLVEKQAWLPFEGASAS
jgi:DNA repair photolyase